MKDLSYSLSKASSILPCLTSRSIRSKILWLSCSLLLIFSSGIAAKLSSYSNEKEEKSLFSTYPRPRTVSKLLYSKRDDLSLKRSPCFRSSSNSRRIRSAADSSADLISSFILDIIDATWKGIPFAARSPVPLVIVSIGEWVIIRIGKCFSVNSAFRSVAKKSSVMPLILDATTTSVEADSLIVKVLYTSPY